MNPDLSKLQPYPFEKLAKLKAQVSPNTELEHIALSIGEPKHTPPEFVLQKLTQEVSKVATYPTTAGLLELRQSIANWLINRFELKGINPENQIIPVKGTREALFAFAQVVIDRTQANPLVVCPNPFYQIYEGAAFLAGANPHFLACNAEQGFMPDYASVPASVWQDCQLLYVCSPGNPTGASLKLEQWKLLIELSERYGFILASDECYSEIYVQDKTPPVGLLQACAHYGNDEFKNCVVFHSLSKRSNLPGLRSGFVAGDSQLIQAFLRFRTYHGCTMGIHEQLASQLAWEDEEHVKENRVLYTQKFAETLKILKPVMDIEQTDASFYLWPKTPINEEDFAQQLFAQQHLTVLPGSYLSRTINGKNPGANRVRMAMVAEVEKCTEAAWRIRHFIESL